MKRKVIALVTACPEEHYQQQVFKGVFEQCAKYGYNVAVFACNLQNYHYFHRYLEGERNIYNLPDFSKFDGVIVTTVPIRSNQNSHLDELVLERLKEKCKCKVISIDHPLGDYDTIYIDDKTAFREITEHVIKVHRRKKIYCLTGHENTDVSHKRLSGYREALEANGMKYSEDNVFFGNFYYNSGEELAERIASGEIAVPDAVICANDTMAIGLTNRLIEKGYEVPEDIIVTGYDAINEAYVNNTSITTYIPDVYTVAARAVNLLREDIEPGEPVASIDSSKDLGIAIGESCGCANHIKANRLANKDIYNRMYGSNLINENDPYNIARLSESFMYEHLISADNVDEMFASLDVFTYLIKPFKEFFLVLRENWMDLSDPCEEGYPDKMLLKIHRTVKYEMDDRVHPLFTPDDTRAERLFDTNIMLENMYEESDEGHVYYFSPLHFSQDTFGYTVIKCDYHQEEKLASLFRNWIRDVGNALEMSRIRARLLDDSYEDHLTNLYNRRGMYSKVKKLKNKNQDKDMFVIMVDMDGLKLINDTYGHDEGDFGIMTIANAIKANTHAHDISVRSGGDEFLMIGCGKNMEDVVKEKIESIRQGIASRGIDSGKPYNISASFGYVISPVSEGVSLDDLIKEADERMYEEKKTKHSRNGK